MSTWQAVGEALAGDFADLPDAAQFTRTAVRLLMAAILGGVIGFEREQRGKAAGMRTHMLVALGSALFVLVVQQSGGSSEGVSRVIQGLVAGIGFIGAGAILGKPRGEHVTGLTTAASIWLTAAIGVATGLGRGGTALLVTVLALVVLAILPRFERWAVPDKPTENSPPPAPPVEEQPTAERSAGRRKMKNR
jgi:putative Mg2+ transporter-C (MgtC) family protein